MKHLPVRLPVSGSTVSFGELTRRAALLLGIVALHVLVILWLASRTPPEQAARPVVMSVFAISLSSGRAASAQPPIQTKVVYSRATPVPVPTPASRLMIENASASAVDVSAAAGADAAGGCALAREAGQAIGQDPAAMAELEALPPSIRTSADAVMLWNGQWLDPGVMPAGIESGSLRRVVEQVVAAAPAECRDAAATGPQFIPVPASGRTVMIVVGSGAWHWIDLITDHDACPAEGAATCRATSPAPLNGKLS